LLDAVAVGRAVRERLRVARGVLGLVDAGLADLGRRLVGLLGLVLVEVLELLLRALVLGAFLDARDVVDPVLERRRLLALARLGRRLGRDLVGGLGRGLAPEHAGEALLEPAADCRSGSRSERLGAADRRGDDLAERRLERLGAELAELAA